MKLTKDELSAKGRAFDHGYDSQRAVRLFQEGVGVTAADDLALALGFPLIVELAPDAEGDLVELTKAQLCQPLRRLVPWPRNLAVRAARTIAFGWDQFPNVLSAEAVEALERDEDFQEGEASELVNAFCELPSASWNQVYELFFLLEALAGGEETIAAVCEAIEADDEEWNSVDIKRRIVIVAVGAIFDRLSADRADTLRPRLEALFARYTAFDSLANKPELTGVPLRALDLVLHGALGYERSAGTTEWGRDRTDAHFFGSRGVCQACRAAGASDAPHVAVGAMAGPGRCSRACASG